MWPDAKLFHYRTRAGAEVDFVLEVGRDLWGIEVKASRQVAKQDGSGLASLAGRASRLTRQIIVFLGSRAQQVGKLEVIPLSEFLVSLPA
ncbi:MAG: DUF4143 domain-containing protein [Planctomycetes bacterium]|nr:DUF4143 domain-containing protein [Planctomycetota bacterium]